MGNHSKSAFHKDLLVLVIIALTAVSVTPSAILTDKSLRMQNVVFKYNAAKHNVMKVKKTEYEKCHVPKDQSKVLKTGNDVVTLKTKGTKYFLCGEPGHCAGSQKLAVNVTA
ncbi:Blue copper protein 1a [Linum perenne]